MFTDRVAATTTTTEAPSPALPIGGFSYSECLEAAVDSGRVASEADAAAWLLDQLHLSLARADLAVLAQAIPAWQQGDHPRIAIREDCSINLEAIDSMLVDHPDADIVFIESGGDNLAATFSPELSDLTIYVIDVAAGEKIPRKGGPGITKSDLFVINKTDLAPYVGANLAVMEADTRRMRSTPKGLKPFVMTNLKTLTGLAEVVAFIVSKGMLQVV